MVAPAGPAVKAAAKHTYLLTCAPPVVRYSWPPIADPAPVLASLQTTVTHILSKLEALRARRFQERVQRVVEVMRREGVDWRGVPYITPEGRIAVRVVPVEMNHPPGD